MIERFLTDVLGIPWDEVHEEAERLEHAMSPVLEERMRAAIGDAKTCPHGHPIVEGAREQGVLLADVEVGASVARPALRERGRGAAPLPEGRRAAPGLEGTVESSDDDEVVIASEDGTHRSPAASPRPSRCVPTRRRRRARRCPSSWSSPATATGAEAAITGAFGGLQSFGYRLELRPHRSRSRHRRSAKVDFRDPRG